MAVLGKTVADNLFEGGDPIGQTIRIKNVPLTVIGEVAPKGQSPGGQDQDDVILVPFSTAKRPLLGSSHANVRRSARSWYRPSAPGAMGRR